MASYNRVILVGNLTRDPELRYIASGTAVTDIGLAVNDRRKNPNGEWEDETTFVDITLWGRQAEVASEYLSKGSPVLIEGRLKLDTWESNDGQKRSKLKVVGLRMQMLGAPRAGGARRPPSQDARYDEAAPPEESYEPPPQEPPDDDIPF
jgi:single-strand DNA-binding protein